MKKDLFDLAIKKKMYLTDGVEFARTVPVRKGDGFPFIGFIKTSLGEHKVHFDNPVLHDLFMSGKSISKKKYDTTVVTVINDIAV